MAFDRQAAEKQACRAFPDPRANDLEAGAKRNFQILSPIDFLAEFTQHIPPKGFHIIRYFSWYSNKSRGMRKKSEEAAETLNQGNACILPPARCSQTWAKRDLAHYCDGVNCAFAKRRPWELKLLGYHPEPWSIEDSIAISRMIGYLTLSQSQAEMERLFVEMVQAGISDTKLDELFPGLLGGLDRELIERKKKTPIEITFYEQRKRRASPLFPLSTRLIPASLSKRMKHFTLGSILVEINGWIETGQSAFREEVASLRAATTAPSKPPP